MPRNTNEPSFNGGPSLKRRKGIVERIKKWIEEYLLFDADFLLMKKYNGINHHDTNHIILLFLPQFFSLSSPIYYVSIVFIDNFLFSII